MSKHYYLENCSPEDVFSFNNGEATVKSEVVKVAIKEAVNYELAKILENYLKAKNIKINLSKSEENNVLQWLGQIVENKPEIGEALLNQGIPCRLLQPRQNWQNGRLQLKVSLEFVPDGNKEENNRSSSDEWR